MNQKQSISITATENISHVLINGKLSNELSTFFKKREFLWISINKAINALPFSI